MQLRSTLPVLLALVLVPVAAGFAAPTADLAEPAAEPVLAQQSGSATETGGASGSAGGGAAAAGNYTRLYIDAERPYLQLKPGDSDTFTVTVENAEDHAVELDPHLYVPPAGGPVVDPSWVSIVGPTALAPDEAAEYTVTVAVPDDAEIGRFSGQVAFTDETVAYPGRPPRPVHAQHLRVEVWAEPTVRVTSETYVHAQVEAGGTLTREITVENTGDQPVPLAPEVARQRGVCHGDCPGRFDRSWLDIDAPNQVDPGETATVTLTVAPPADAERGRYSTEISLGLKDPNRPERDAHWQTVDLNVEVWRQPETPFTTTFSVSERADAVRVTLSPRSAPYPTGSTDAEPGFDVAFVDPGGSTVEAIRVEVTDRGFVDMSDDARGAGDGTYAARGGVTQYVYAIEDPAAGEWVLRVTPENTVGFSYEITRDEAS